MGGKLIWGREALTILVRLGALVEEDLGVVGELLHELGVVLVLVLPACFSC